LTPIADRDLIRSRRALALATAAMLLLSRPLWVGGGSFPRVPFGRGLAAWPIGADGGLFGLALLGLVAAAGRRYARVGLGLSAVALSVLIVWDQGRFQPWAYQFIATAMALAVVPGGRGLGYARLFILGLYLHSGLSKLDVSFGRELGPAILARVLGPVGVEVEAWPDRWRQAAALAMPAGEIAIGLGLACRWTRRAALVGAVGLHAALIVALGPWGLGHSAIVLVWNASLIAQDLILFGGRRSTSVEDSSHTWAEGPLNVVYAIILIGPMGERGGWFDSWPGHALYASHAERTAIDLATDHLPAYPPSIRRHADASGGAPWARLDLTAWSRAERGVPLYPQSRACNGLAEALAARYGGPRPVRVVHSGRADRRTGRRDRVELLGLGAIRRWGDRCWLNAHPSTPTVP